jgi:anthranilate phosphoribosyltransferase
MIREAIAEVAGGRNLTIEQAEATMDDIMNGEATDAQIGGLLVGLRLKGETVDEMVGFVTSMKRHATTIAAPAGAVDTCGTGGDGSHTLNLSSAAAVIVAACGVPVAKHGNRNFSSKSGAADILAALGVNIDAEPALVRRAMFEAGIGFLMAPRYHSAMRHVGPTRVELGTRTIFNLLGPLSNPAGAKRQLVGVFAPHWVMPVAEVLGKLGSERAWVVHGSGLDELTTAGTSMVAELKEGRVRCFEVAPEDAGLPRANLDDIRGGDPGTNAAKLTVLLDGRRGPLRDIVLLNAAAALIVAGRARDLRQGVDQAASSVDTGAARRVLERLIAITNGKA